MQLIQDAGFTGIAILGLFVTALGFVLTGKSKSALPWGVALLALGEVGQALGMRAVSDAVTGDKVVMDIGVIVAVGSAEASANLLLGGLAALVVLGLGFVKSRSQE